MLKDTELVSDELDMNPSNLAPVFLVFKGHNAASCLPTATVKDVKFL